MVSALRRLPRALLVVLAGLLTSCTTVGIHVPGARDAADFGPPLDLRVCVLADRTLPPGRPAELMAAIAREFAPYGIRVQLTSVEPWDRPGFLETAIVDDVMQRPVPDGCDRLLAFVGRNLGDTLWSLALPEVLGAVESRTSTRGYVVAEVGSVAQLIWSPPRATAVHEFYHFLGCHHALTKTACYAQIRALKAAYVKKEDFFPGVTADGEPILSRAPVSGDL